MPVNIKPQNTMSPERNQEEYWIWKNRDERILVDKYDFRNKILSHLALEAHYETVSILNDLSELHYDRILEYELATKELGLEDADLKILFAILIADSRDHLSELRREIQDAGGEQILASANSGKSYRRWTNFGRVNPNCRKEILAMCATAERIIQKAYAEAFSEKDIPASIKALVASHINSLKMSAAKIDQLINQHHYLSAAS